MRRYASLLDARDRALYERWVLRVTASRRVMRAWSMLTHLGGPSATIAAVLAPLLFGGSELRAAAGVAAWTLAISHGVVHVVKRRWLRSRPALARVGQAHVAVP